MTGRPTILLSADYFRPGFKAGGPIRTLGNLVDHLGGEIDFRILTRNNDFSDPAPYPGIAPDCWTAHGPAKVWYASPEGMNREALATLLNDTPHDLLYLNSFFSGGFTIPLLMLRRKGRIPSRPVLLAPRGEFSPEALALKAWKKSAWLTVATLLGVYEKIAWQASGPHEAAQIKKRFPAAPVTLAPNLPGAVPESVPPNREKRPGRLEILFLGRLSPMKNVQGLFEMLHGVSGQVRLTLCGPRENAAYWEACRPAREGLPENVTVQEMGEIPPVGIPAVIADHHLLFLPTLGENFGHAILECLSQGCPALISDRTPWRGLAKADAGWDLPLEEPARFTAVLNDCIALGPKEWATKRAAAAAFARETAGLDAGLAANRALFAGALAGGGR